MANTASSVGPALRAVPNILTAARIVAIPPLVIAFFLPSPWREWLPLVLFVFASVTDWLDGVLARRWQAGSRIGQLMDPIADKLLVVAVILMLTAEQVIGGWHLVPALAILCREMFVSGLREFLALHGVGMPVTPLAKWKTTAQMAALTALLVPEPTVGLVGLGLFWVAAALSLQTGFAYFRKSAPHFVARDDETE